MSAGICPVAGFSSAWGLADNEVVSPSPSDNGSVDRRSVIKAAAAVAGLLAAGGATAWAAVAGGGALEGSPGAAGSSPSPTGRGSADTRPGRGASGDGSERPGGGKSGSSDKEGKPSDGSGDSRGQEDPSDPGAQPTEDTKGSATKDDPAGQGDGKPSDPDHDPGGNKPDNDNDGNGDGNGNGGDPGVPALLQATAVPVGGGVVVPQHRIVVTQPQAGTFRCFGSRCTHAGCMVDAVTEGTIHCPCHGSLFDMTTGEPVAGPAPRALDSVAIKVKSGGIYRA